MRQPDLFIGGAVVPAPVFHNGVPTSRAAAESVRGPIADGDESAVYEAIRQAGGLTCAEVEARLGLSHQTASARVHGLHRVKGWIEDSGQRRPTPSGRAAIVYRVAQP